MSMILTAYNVIKPLPPEGSEEWLAMLPGWTGWIYSFEYGPDTPTTQWHVNRYWSETPYGGTTIRVRIAWGGADNYIVYDTLGDDPMPSPIGNTYYAILGSYYYFRGAVVPNGGDISGGTGYYVGRATSLTPQR